MAFEGCRNIQSLYCYAETPPAMPDNDLFDAMVKENAILYVPTGCKSKYEAAEQWKDFLNIQEMVQSDEAQSGIEDTIAEEVTVIVQNGTIVVNGLEKPVSIEVYSLNGQLLYRGTETTIPITERGIYILRMLDKSFKVVDVSK